MSEVKHVPGSFCWVELTTNDREAAKQFYGELLGWTTNDDPIPDGGVYTMASVAGGNVGGMFQITDDMKKQGVPPHWQVYVSVADADASAAKAKNLGGTVMMEPFDVMEFGRMAIIKDPAGASFSIWQPKLHQGYGHAMPQIGTPCWHELGTSNVDAAGKFYSSLFNWAPKVQDMEGTQYTMFQVDDKPCGGMMEMQGEQWAGIPPHWTVYFQVASCAETVAKAEKLGGKVLVPPTPIPNMGGFALLQDGGGANFGIFESASK